MRDLLFKNLTSADRKKKIIASCEIIDKQGVRSVIRRHFICIVKEIQSKEAVKPSSYLYVLKERNTKEHIERFFCRMKGSMLTQSNERTYIVTFIHSLRIQLSALQNEVIESK